MSTDKSVLTSLIRDTMITNRRLDTEQKDLAVHRLKAIAPDDLARPVRLMSEHLNLVAANRADDDRRDDGVCLDAFGREMKVEPPQETYQQFKARRLKELAAAAASRNNAKPS